MHLNGEKGRKMLFNGGKLTGNEPMDRRFMFMKTNNPGGGGGCLPSLLVYIFPDLR